MKTLWCTVGLPLSGKTTWAKNQPYPIVNPDSIRLSIHGKRYIQMAEPLVWSVAIVMVRALFLAGHDNVIVDATNNTRKRRDFWKSEQWTRKFVPIRTPAYKCKARAMAANDNEIIPVIDRMVLEREPLEDNE